MTLSEKQTQSSFYSAREYLIPGLFFTFFPSASAYSPFFRLSYPCACSDQPAHGPAASDSPRPEGNVQLL